MPAKSKPTLELRLINHYADRFEDQLALGGSPAIEDFLPSEAEPQLVRKLLTVLIELQLDYLDRKNQAAEIERLQSKFPEYRDLIQHLLASLEANPVSPPSASETNNRVFDDTFLEAANGTIENPPEELHTESTPMFEGIDKFPVQFGRYEITGEIGKGGMGSVYRAVDTLLSRDVAIKIPKFSNDHKDSLERFYREARSAAAISHPNICPIYDVGEIEGKTFISMAFIPGESLAQLIKRKGQLPSKEAARIALHLANAFSHIHEWGVIHRDLKPSNVMINENGEVVILDFGLARRAGGHDEINLTQTGMLVGSPAHMAPEQIRDSSDVTSSVDIYALGIVLYGMLTGKVPFSGDLLSVIDQIRYDVPDTPSELGIAVDVELEAICLKAIAKSPTDRFPTMGSMADSLLAYLDRDISPGKLPSVVDDSPFRSKSRNRRVAGFLRMALLAAFVLAGIVILIPTERGVIRIDVSDPTITVQVRGSETEIHDKDGTVPIKVKPGSDQKLEIRRGEFRFSTNSFALKAGEDVLVKVDFIDNAIVATMNGDDWHEFAFSDTVPSPRQQKVGLPLEEDSESFTNPPKFDPRYAKTLAKWEEMGSRFYYDTSISPDQLWSEKALHLINAKLHFPPGDNKDEFIHLLDACPKIERLAVQAETLSADDWNRLAEAKAIKTLILSVNTPLTLSALTSLERLQHPSELGIHENFTDDQLKHIKSLKQLRSVNLINTQLTGQGLDVVADLPRIMQISLVGNPLEGKHLVDLTRANGLQTLYLSKTPLTGEHLSHLASCRSLRTLYLEHCPELKDISGLEESPIQELHLAGSVSVTDVSPILKMNLKVLTGSFSSEQVAQLRAVKPDLNIVVKQLAFQRNGLRKSGE